MSEFRGFVIPAQFGGPEAGAGDEIWRLKFLVQERMRNTHILGIESVHCGFLVDGRLVQYRCAKTEGLRFFSKKKEIWVHLGVPISAWEGRTSVEIRTYLCECFEEAIALIIERAKRKKLCDGCELLWADWEAVKSEFLRPE